MSVLHLLAFQESKQKLFLKFQDGVFAGQNPFFKFVMSLETISVWCLNSPCSEHGCFSLVWVWTHPALNMDVSVWCLHSPRSEHGCKQPMLGCLHKIRNEQMLSLPCSRALACISREARNRYDELQNMARPGRVVSANALQWKGQILYDEEHSYLDVSCY